MNHLSEVDRLSRERRLALDSKNFVKAFKLSIKLAEMGDVVAYLGLGNSYDYGEGVEMNKKKALYWYKKFWEAGYAGGATNMAVHYSSIKNYKKSEYWWKQEIQLGDRDGDAHLGLAKMYLKKSGEKNYEKIVELLRIASEHENAADWDKEDAKQLLRQVLNSLFCGTEKIWSPKLVRFS